MTLLNYTYFVAGTVKKRPMQAKKPVRRKKKKKNSLKDLLPALFLCAALILVSLIISLIIIGFDKGNPVQTNPALMQKFSVESPSVPQELAPQDKPVEPAKPVAQSKPAEPAKPVVQSKPAEPVKPVVQSKPTAQIHAAAMAAVSIKPKEKKTLVFIIDDAGNNLGELEPFLRFPGPLTIAVLPGLPHSAEAARRIRAAGKEVFLHQPMEAVNGQYPGPGAIYSWMSADEINKTLKQNFAELSPVKGMNNHQGSIITADKEKMKTILAFCKSNGIDFIDSKTTGDSAAASVAAGLGMKIGERNIFIDNLQDRQSMINYINRGLELADQKGGAVMIGHTWSPGLASLLTENYKNYIDKGYELTTASKFINSPR